MKYVDERRYNGFERLVVVIIFSTIWGLIGTGKTSILGEIFINLWLAFCAEFSFEYEKKVLKIRAAGKKWTLDNWLRFLIWPLGRPLSLLGVKNCPILAILMTFIGVYLILAGIQFLDIAVHILLIWFLYYLRKVDK